MLTFYDKYLSLCASVNKKPSKVAEEIGLSRPAVNGWKVGRSNPSDVTLSKLATYFNVSVEYLKGETEEVEEIKKDPISENGNEVSEIDQLVLNLFHNLTPENKQKVLAHLFGLGSE